MKTNRILLCFVVLILISCNSKTNNESLSNTIPIKDLLRCNENTNDNLLVLKSFHLNGPVYVAETKEFCDEKTQEIYHLLINYNVNKEKESFHTLYGGHIISYAFSELTFKIWDGYLFNEDEEVPYSGDFYNYHGLAMPSLSSDKDYLSFYINNDIVAKYDGIDVTEELKNIQFSKFDGEILCVDEFVTVSFNNDLGHIVIYENNIFSISSAPNVLYQLNENRTFSFLS